MIIKSFEIEKFDLDKINFYLFYGENEGFKNEIIKKKFESFFSDGIHKYEEKEILENKESFFNEIFTQSFFEKKKVIIISRATDKITNILEEIIERKVRDVKILLNSSILEKKSNLRKLFETKKNCVCVPFYSDNYQTLSKIAFAFFSKIKIQLSQENLNLLISRCNGDRQNLNNELNKIENFVVNKKNMSLDDVLKLTNLTENYNTFELVDNCLSKNYKKTINILNENNYTSDESILIIKTLLNRSKRLFHLRKQTEQNKNIDLVISSFKPPIFWKEKEIVKQQIKNWSLKNIENLIYETNEIELLIKKNSSNSLNIVSDFLINQSNKVSN
tara:strand:+ start:12904 stop:13899 length:996 start_codon:yes stop_codon:yes gene_type:complete